MPDETQQPNNQPDAGKAPDAPRTVASKRLSLSGVQKRWLWGGMAAVLVIAGYATYAVITNVTSNAAACSAKTYAPGSDSSCVKYAQQLLNGVDRHFAPIAQNNTTLSSDSVSDKGILNSETQAKITTFQKYTAIAADGSITKNTWYQLCAYAKEAVDSYSKNVAPSKVTTAQSAYKKAGCSSAQSEVVTNVTIESATLTTTTAPTAVQDTDNDDSALQNEPAVALNPSDASTAIAESPEATTTTDDHIKIVTWNIEGGDPTSFAASLDAHKQGMASLENSADIISLQESHQATFRTFLDATYSCATCTMVNVIPTDIPSGKNAYSVNGSLPDSLPIFWKRARFDLKNYGVFTAYAKSYTDAMGPVSNKWITWVKLYDRVTEKSLYVFNTHTVASVESKGLASKYSGRVSIYKSHLALLTNKIKSYQTKDAIPVVVTGDFNVNYRYDSTLEKHYKYFPYTVLEVNAQLSSNWGYAVQNNSLPVSGTQGANDRLIDYIYISKRDDTTFTDTNIGSASYGSDHFPISATIAVK